MLLIPTNINHKFAKITKQEFCKAKTASPNSDDSLNFRLSSCKKNTLWLISANKQNIEIWFVPMLLKFVMNHCKSAGGWARAFLLNHNPLSSYSVLACCTGSSFTGALRFTVGDQVEYLSEVLKTEKCHSVWPRSCDSLTWHLLPLLSTLRINHAKRQKVRICKQNFILSLGESIERCDLSKSDKKSVKVFGHASWETCGRPALKF